MGPVTSWVVVAPSTDDIEALITAYGCELWVEADLFVVRHASGRTEKVGSLDEVVDAAVKLARQR